jgi:hypothetical protein
MGNKQLARAFCVLSYQVCLCGVLANLLTDLVDLLLVELIAALVLNTLDTTQHKHRSSTLSS